MKTKRGRRLDVAEGSDQNPQRTVTIVEVSDRSKERWNAALELLLEAGRDDEEGAA